MAAFTKGIILTETVDYSAESYLLREESDSVSSDELSSLEAMIPSAKATARVKQLEDLGVKGIASFDTYCIRDVGQSTGNWIDGLTKFNSHLRGIAYALFHRQNIPSAHRLLLKIDDLVGHGGKRVDLMILTAECEIVMGNYDLAVVRKALVDLKVYIKETNIQFMQDFVKDYDEALKQNGRHMARIFLQYMAYYSTTLNVEKGDDKMKLMATTMLKIAERFLIVETHTARNAVAWPVRGILRDWYDLAGKLEDGNFKTKAYVRALSCNYEAWICIKLTDYTAALAIARRGIENLAQAYADGEHKSLALFGDLHANRVAAFMYQREYDAAQKEAFIAKMAYWQADLMGVVSTHDLIMELEQTGVNKDFDELSGTACRDSIAI